MASNNTTSQLTIRINGKEVENTFTALNREVRTLSRELRNLTPGTEEFQQRAAQLREAQAHFNRVRDEINQVNGAITQTATSTSRFGDIVRGVFTGNLITSFFSSFVGKARESVDELLKVSDLMTGVEKTTGLASEQVRELWNEFDELNTRTSKQELLNIAQIGGRLGITDKEQIKEFTEEIDKIYVALGDSFQGGLEEVTTKVGKLKNLFKETRDQNYGEALNAIGSALNELGANGSSSEQNITDFATRIGALPAVLKPSIEKTLGLGAAFEESGIDAEVASSGYSRFMSVAGNNIAAFAKQMKLTTKEASELFNTHPEEFFLRFGESLKGLGAEQTAGVLKGLKLNTLEIQKALGTAGDKADRFRELMNLSGQAMQDGTSIQNEFNKVNENTAAIWEKIKKVFAEFFTSDTMAQWFGGLIKLLGWLTGVTSKAGDGVKVFRERIAFLAKAIVVCTTAVASYRAAVYLSTITTKAAWQQTILYNAAMKVTNATTALWKGTVLLLSAAKATLTGNTIRATAAMRTFNLVTKMNPWGLLLGAITAVVTALVLFSNKQKEVNLQLKIQNDAIKEANVQTAAQEHHLRQLLKTANDTNKSYNERKKAVDELNRLVPQYNKQLTVETANTDKAKQALDRYIESIKAAAREKYLKALVDQKAEALAKQEYSSLEENIAWYERALNEMKNFGNPIAAMSDDIVTATKNKAQNVKKANDELKAATDLLLKQQEENAKNGVVVTDDNVTPISPAGEGTKKQPKDYADDYRNANKARLAAEQELQKEITQGLEESLDKQLALTEQKYNDKRFKLQQENADLEQDILKLKTEAKGNNDPNLLKTIQEKRKLQELNKQIAVEYEKQEQAELTQVREKHAAKEVERTLKEMNDCLAVKKREKAEELLLIQDLDTAKEALRGQISDKELSQIKTLEEAKKALRRKADEEILKESLASFEAQKKLLMDYLQTVTGEAKDKLIEDIQKVEDQMTKVKEQLDNLNTKEVDKAAGSELERVDVLGFTAAEWENVFANLDNVHARFRAVEMGIGAMNNAFSAFSQLQENLNARELSKYTANQQKKKQALLDQLNQGYISQAQYQKEVQRLDEEAEAKKKELALKQFKAQKAANMLNIIANTAMAVMRAYSDAGPLAGTALAAIVGAIGAVQLGIVAAQQPPSYAKGGYTKGLGFTDETGQEVAGVVHGKEYVIPAMLLSDPQVARVTEWIEAKRTGKAQNTYATGGNVSAVSAVSDEPSTLAKSESLLKSETSMSELKHTLTQLTATLDRLEKNGLDAYVIADAKNGKEMQRAIKEYENIREKNRR
ncbi:phage tail tape measure protein [Capnocytophaga periodontitidis]|uniref:phage tail tape measure protein n=1 Tax=Capnocytophaga periodontitidis TaxID=2795027 RepID=UPI0018E1B1A1|nr:phage tail tape measure protein [Capnocytophaga periodontitidis]MBI1667500.1 phage tail tape measure protein [Capnocytophaga periodontitidis]